MNRTRSRRLCITCCAAAALCALAFFSGATAAGVLDEIAETGVFRLGLRDDVRPFAYVDPEGRPAGFCVDMAQLLALLNRRVEELLLPVTARLARFLLELCDTQLRRPGTAAGGPRVCRLPMTKRDLAARLGTVPETLSRSLGALKEAGVVRLSGNGELVEVLDFDELARVAQY